mgnify:CR=1 FL=1
MLKFSTFLAEANEKRTHLTHLEDVVLDDGPNGVAFAMKVLGEFYHILDGGQVSKSLNVSVKWDGAPALIFGPDPADGKFFVATKGAFAKNPKLAKSHADIDAMYQSGVKDILHLALDELSKLKPNVVIQGDVLFTSSTISNKTIDGKNYVTFQPNTILYAVDEDSDLYNKVQSAEMGIVLHTMYTGRGGALASYGATALTPSVFASLKKSRSVLTLDAAYDDVSGSATFTTQEKADFELAMGNIDTSARGVSRAVYDAILEDPLHGMLQQFINQTVKDNKRISPQQAAQDFILFLAAKEEKELATRKSDAGKEGVRQKFGGMVGTVRRNAKGMQAWFALHQAISRAKDIVVRKLGQASRIGAFMNTEDGLKVTGPEGFVAVSHTGKAVKLVDRLSFSRMNFAQPKSWK